MTTFVRQPGITELETHLHVRKLEKLLEQETNPLKRDIYRKIIKRALERMEAMGA